jgi:hypothetical protein
MRLSAEFFSQSRDGMCEAWDLGMKRNEKGWRWTEGKREETYVQ